MPFFITLIWGLFFYFYFFIFLVTLVYFYLLFHSSYFSFCFASLHVHLIFYIYFIIHLHSFDWPKERSKKSHAASKNLRILLLKQKIRTRHTATNKNFHGTRCAQTPENFYCFLVNAAKFLMPRLHLTRTFNFLIRRKYIINDNKKYYSSHQP